MTSAEAHDKVLKLLALAAPGSGAMPGEAATAARIANQLCAKYGITPSPPRRAPDTARRTLPGQTIPGWAPPPQQRAANQGWHWWQWVGRPFGSNEVGISGITDAQARAMALTILTTGAYLAPDDLEIVEGALNGLLTEYGKLLLDGLYALST
jgi:hypothetical protein